MRRVRDVSEGLKAVRVQAELEYAEEAIAVDMEGLGAKAVGRRSERYQCRVVCVGGDLREQLSWQIVDANALRSGRGRYLPGTFQV
jgi:hypothetical protein